jgi:hypothetical protein
MSTMKVLLKALPTMLLLAGACVTSNLMAQYDAPSSVTFGDKFTIRGQGCPLYSYSKVVSEDKKSFTITFDQWFAESGPDRSYNDSRKNCQMTIPLMFEPGWTFAIASFDYRGYVRLDPGASATQKSTYYFMGRQAETRTNGTTMNGPIDDNYTFHDEVATSALVWAPCNTSVALPLNVNAEIRTQARGNARGLITVDSVDGNIPLTFNYNLIWRRCR